MSCCLWFVIFIQWKLKENEKLDNYVFHKYMKFKWNSTCLNKQNAWYSNENHISQTFKLTEN